MNENQLKHLAVTIKDWAYQLGFQQVGICDTNLASEDAHFKHWLEKQYHGEMQWLENHSDLRSNPELLHPGTLRIISVRMNYLPPNASFAKTLNNPELGYISRYALGRDYHKLMRQRLKKLGEQITEYCHQHDITMHFRPFVDSAPVMERPLAEKAGLGWTGKHSLILNQHAGSWFFLGELFVSLPLPIDKPVENQCGKCVACLTICPTQAIVEPYTVDARRCISYLTIEYSGSIPVELRPLIGNRIYGCDDCQMICPWNRFAKLTDEADFLPRNQLDSSTLLELYQWNEATFLKMTEGSPIRRIGYANWLRNITIALGNAPYSEIIITQLEMKKGFSELLDEHINWSIIQQLTRQIQPLTSNTKTLRLIRAIEKGLPRDA